MKFSKRTRNILLALLLCIVGFTGLSWTLCGSRDVTDDPALSGGYRRDQIYTLKVDVQYVAWGRDESKPSGDLNRIRYKPLYGALVSSGTRLRLISVHREPELLWRPWGFNSIEAEILDGPWKGKVVKIEGISSPKPDSRHFSLDPEVLE